MKNVKLKNRFLISIATILAIVSPSLVNASSVKDDVKDAIDKVGDALKSAVEEIDGDIAAVQNYLDNYHWKGILQETASSGVATLSDMTLNGHKRAVAVKPGERIEGSVLCSLDPSQCNSLSFYRVVLGIKGLGGQTTVCNYLGALAGKSIENFVLIAPSETGIYQIRFRPTVALLESTALSEWKDKNGDEPDGTTTIGIIVVK